MFKSGRHLKYTRWNCSRSFWGDTTTVVIPHIIPGWSWYVKLCHARLGGRGQDFILSAQMYPFCAISHIWGSPPGAGPRCTPSIKEASLLRKVGIGAIVPSGSGTCKCNGAIFPVGRVMGAIESGNALIVLNLARRCQTSRTKSKRNIYQVSLQPQWQ
jgi:hypothetical protein